jgi:Uma2 family endonuclease
MAGHQGRHQIQLRGGTMANPMIKYRVRDYMSIPDGDERRYELIDGELMLAPAPVPTHQMVVLELATILKEFVERHRLGRVFISPIDVVLSEHDVLQPDILFISTERLHIVGERVRRQKEKEKIKKEK